MGRVPLPDADGDGGFRGVVDDHRLPHAIGKRIRDPALQIGGPGGSERLDVRRRGEAMGDEEIRLRDGDGRERGWSLGGQHETHPGMPATRQDRLEGSARHRVRHGVRFVDEHPGEPVQRRVDGHVVEPLRDGVGHRRIRLAREPSGLDDRHAVVQEVAWRQPRGVKYPPRFREGEVIEDRSACFPRGGGALDESSHPVEGVCGLGHPPEKRTRGPRGIEVEELTPPTRRDGSRRDRRIGDDRGSTPLLEAREDAHRVQDDAGDAARGGEVLRDDAKGVGFPRSSLPRQQADVGAVQVQVDRRTRAPIAG